MILNSDSIKPIYIQIAEWLETEILGGSIEEDAKVHSQYQLAEMLNINPATAAKGLNLLADDGILYKKRGLGMFVSTEAKSIILSKRKTKHWRDWWRNWSKRLSTCMSVKMNWSR